MVNGMDLLISSNTPSSATNDMQWVSGPSLVSAILAGMVVVQVYIPTYVYILYIICFEDQPSQIGLQMSLKLYMKLR